MRVLCKCMMGLALALTVSATARAADEFVLLGVHPEAKNQSTATGRTIATLYGYNNMVYPGYGDYGANTGPIAIHPWDIAANAWTPAPLLMSRTEAIYTYREINGRLYAPAIDAKNLEDHSYAYTVGNSNVWQDAPGIDPPRVAEHAFDIVGYHGDLYLASMVRGNTADIYKSTDNGTTWTRDHTVYPSAQGDFNRFYGLVVYKDKIWTQAEAYYNYAPLLPDHSEVYDGTSWTTGPSLRVPSGGHAPFNHPIVFADKVVFSWTTGVGSYFLYQFDGTNPVSYLFLWNTSPHWVADDNQVYDYMSDGTTLWALTKGHHIYTTTDLLTWTFFGDAPTNATSILAYQDKLYLGTSNSQLMVWSAPVPEPASLSMLAFGGLMLLHRRRGA